MTAVGRKKIFLRIFQYLNMLFPFLKENGLLIFSCGSLMYFGFLFNLNKNLIFITDSSLATAFFWPLIVISIIIAAIIKVFLWPTIFHISTYIIYNDILSNRFNIFKIITNFINNKKYSTSKIIYKNAKFHKDNVDKFLNKLASSSLTLYTLTFIISLYIYIGLYKSIILFFIFILISILVSFAKHSIQSKRYTFPYFNIHKKKLNVNRILKFIILGSIRNITISMLLCSFIFGMFRADQLVENQEIIEIYIDNETVNAKVLLNSPTALVVINNENFITIIRNDGDVQFKLKRKKFTIHSLFR